MGTVALAKAYAAKTISGNPPTEWTFPEASGTQSFKAGEFVYLVAGKVTEIGDNPGVILGMAAQDASGTADTDIAVVIANGDTVFALNKVSDTGGSGTGGTGAATAVTDVGKGFSIYRDTTNNIAHAGTANATTGIPLFCVGVLGRKALPPSGGEGIGDTGGRLLVQVHGRHRQFSSTSGG